MDREDCGLDACGDERLLVSVEAGAGRRDAITGRSAAGHDHRPVPPRGPGARRCRGRRASLVLATFSATVALAVSSSLPPGKWW